jgi:Rha family phage regulatory protein
MSPILDRCFRKALSQIHTGAIAEVVYFMNRDGFTLLAMGFTGKKALGFKLKYIEAFNQMEETIKAQRTQLPTDANGSMLRN